MRGGAFGSHHRARVAIEVIAVGRVARAVQVPRHLVGRIIAVGGQAVGTGLRFAVERPVIGVSEQSDRRIIGDEQLVEQIVGVEGGGGGSGAVDLHSHQATRIPALDDVQPGKCYRFAGVS